MPIGQLYNTNNVVVGQAACLIAPANTPMPPPASAVMTDPFSLAPWAAATLSTSGPLTAGTFILTYTVSGTPYATTANPWNVTAVALQTAIVNALATFPAAAGGPALPSEVSVTGGPLTTVATPFSIAVAERLMGGTWSVTPTGITGGVLSLTQPLWTPVGATDQGWTFASNKSTQAINIEEQSAPVAMEMTTQSLTISGALSEDISNTLAVAYNMTAVVNASTTLIPAYTQLNPTDNILLYAVVLIMANRLNYPRWLYIPQSTCLANASGAFRRAAAKRMYTADFQSVCPIASIQIYDFTAPHQ
jgi:hypothetical protein